MHKVRWLVAFSCLFCLTTTEKSATPLTRMATLRDPPLCIVVKKYADICLILKYKELLSELTACHVAIRERASDCEVVSPATSER